MYNRIKNKKGLRNISDTYHIHIEFQFNLKRKRNIKNWIQSKPEHVTVTVSPRLEKK